MYESVKTIQDIRDEHIDVLRDFGVKVTSQIVRTIETKTPEIAIENYCRVLIMKRLEQYAKSLCLIMNFVRRWCYVESWG